MSSSYLEDAVGALPPSTDESSGGKDRFYTTFIAAFTASLASICFGYTLGYTSPTQTEMENDPRLKITGEQFSWFASLIAIGALIGSMVAGFCVDRFGRKSTILMTSIFFTTGWCLISYAENVSMLYAGRIFTGIGVGMSSLAVPVYIAEIASARLRGGLGAMNQLGVTIGIFIAYIVGSTLSWEWSAMFAVMLVAIMVILMSFMPETPRWLLAHNKRHKAIKELEWLRGPLYDVEEECFEIENNLDQQEKVSLKDFLTPGLYKPLIIGSLMMVFQQFCGINAILFFDAKIFSTAGFNDAEVVALSVGGAQVIATGVSCLIVDKAGRRILLMIGGFAMFLCLALLGVYYDVADIPLQAGEKAISIFGKVSHSIPLNEISWLAIVCVIIYIIVFSLGWGPLPWLLMSEIFPPRARGIASGIVTFLNWALVFLITKTFHSMTITFYEQGTFWFFSVFSFSSFIFALFFVPETKGKTLEEIEQIFTKRRKRSIISDQNGLI